METRRVGRATRQRVELLRAVDARTLTALGNVHTDANGVARTEHVAVMPLGVLPHVEEIVRSLKGGLHPTSLEIIEEVVSDILAAATHAGTIDIAITRLTCSRIMLEGIGIGHVLAPRTSFRGHSVRHDQLGQTSVGAVGIHLLNDEGLDDLGLGLVIDLGPINPVKTAVNVGIRSGGIAGGGSIADRGVGLLSALLGGLQGSLSVGEVLTKLSLTLRVGLVTGRVARSRVGVLGEQRVVLSSDASVCASEGRAEGILGGMVSLGQRGDHNEGCRDRGGGEHHRGVSAGELERH